MGGSCIVGVLRYVPAGASPAARRRVYFHFDGGGVITPAAQVSIDGGAWTASGIGAVTSIGADDSYADLDAATIETAGTLVGTRLVDTATGGVIAMGDEVLATAFDPCEPFAFGATALPRAIPGTDGGFPRVVDFFSTSSGLGPDQLAGGSIIRTIADAVLAGADPGASLWALPEGDPAFAAAGTIGHRVKSMLDVAVGSRLAATEPGRTLDVSEDGTAGVDWANVSSPGASQDLSGTGVGAVAGPVVVGGYAEGKDPGRLALAGLAAVIAALMAPAE